MLPLFAFLTSLPDSLLTVALHILVGAVLIWLAAALWQHAEATALSTSRLPVAP